jgi:hypothetical protein
MTIISETTLKALRQRAGLEETDTSLDDDFRRREPMRNLRDVVDWHLGDGSWADQIIEWGKELDAINYV